MARAQNPQLRGAAQRRRRVRQRVTAYLGDVPTRSRARLRLAPQNDPESRAVITLGFHVFAPPCVVFHVSFRLARS